MDQVTILETMTPLDFMEFREYLSPASGFQSVQFRLLENKLGVRNDLRTNYGKQYYLKIFEDQAVIRKIKASEDEDSLCDLLEYFLEATPGLDNPEFSFWEKYKRTVLDMLQANQLDADKQLDKYRQEDNDDEQRQEFKIRYDQMQEEIRRKREMFDSIFDVNKHMALVARGDRRISHKALQGALMISLYRDEPRFNQPFQILLLLMDIDSLITKWRSMLVPLSLQPS